MPLVPLALERQGADNLWASASSPLPGDRHAGHRRPYPASRRRFGAVPFIFAAVVAGSAISMAYTLTDSPAIVVRSQSAARRDGGVPWIVSEIWMNVVVEESCVARVMRIYSRRWWHSASPSGRSFCRCRIYGPVPFVSERSRLAGGAPAALLEDSAGDPGMPTTADM